MIRMLGLIPARQGSEKVKNKNFKELGGKTLLARAIESAVQSGVFRTIVVSSDSDQAQQIAADYGVVFVRRPSTISGSMSPDRFWIQHALDILVDAFEYYAILRPTNPFRTADTIRRAVERLFEGSLPGAGENGWHSLRSVQPVRERPEKMWRIVDDDGLTPYLTFPSDVPGDHDPKYECQSATFPELFVQNGCIDICKKDNLDRFNSYLGHNIRSFFTRGYEGFDINTKSDWDFAEYLISHAAEVMELQSSPLFVDEYWKKI